MAKSKLGVEDVEQEIRQNRYTLTPTGVMKFADFMHRAGMIPQRPTSWKEIFFDTVHHLPGN
jgi:NitT/TauT family transport system substrate-binding protein